MPRAARKPATSHGELSEVRSGCPAGGHAPDITLVTTYGVRANEHSRALDLPSVTMDALFGKA